VNTSRLLALLGCCGCPLPASRGSVSHQVRSPQFTTLHDCVSAFGNTWLPWCCIRHHGTPLSRAEAFGTHWVKRPSECLVIFNMLHQIGLQHIVMPFIMYWESEMDICFVGPRKNFAGGERHVKWMNNIYQIWRIVLAMVFCYVMRTVCRQEFYC